MIITEENYLAHYGILRKSGRYPWGSGGTQTARNRSYLDTIAGLRKQGLSDTEIASGLGITTTQLRAATTIARTEQKQSQINQAQRLKDKGLSNVAIGQRMGINESSVRSLLAPGVEDRNKVLAATSNMLKEQVEAKGFIDVGKGVENHVGVSKDKLSTAVAMLREEGYTLHYVKVQQLGTGKNTTVKVLAKPGVTYSEVLKNKDNITQPFGYSEDGGRTFLGIMPPLQIKASRVAVRYAEDGGAEADGVIFVRPGVKDVSLGAAPYAQVRIAVNGTHYLKGMAMYKDDLPDGVDLQFNTNKSNTGNKLDALKPLKTTKDGEVDQDNPFGAVVRQIPERDEHGVAIKGTVSSAMNIVNEAGDWNSWSKSLSSQFLSKQSPQLAKQQLDMAYERQKNDLDTILKMTNPAVQRKLLESFADGADSASVHLKAAALPRQATKVILPIASLKDNEIYAPTFRNGETVVLVRHPHGGTFEIPELTVNNRHPEAKKAIGPASEDAVGISPKTAERLSGADFDGDSVIVIPNGSGRVKTTPALAGLVGFDPKASYPKYEGMEVISPSKKQHEMGNVSNLITDMTIKGASQAELARAVRHSMVVIDSEKHELDYKQSAIDNGIGQLKAKYQGKSNAGAATLISRAGSSVRVPERKEGYRIDPATGAKVFTETGASFVDPRSGKTVIRTTKTSKLAEATDARTLSSGTPIEKIYADHSNKLKALANQARLVQTQVRSTPYSKSAKAAYSEQVNQLNAALNIALRNAPLERQAQVLANATVSTKRQAYPDMDKETLKKIQGQALAEARNRVGAGKTRIEITDAQWAAIQAGAISNHKLTEILNNADLDRVKELAAPRANTVMTKTKVARAKQMLAAGYTQAEIADQLGVAVSTLSSSIKSGDV